MVYTSRKPRKRLYYLVLGIEINFTTDDSTKKRVRSEKQVPICTTIRHSIFYRMT